MNVSSMTTVYDYSAVKCFAQSAVNTTAISYCCEYDTIRYEMLFELAF